VGRLFGGLQSLSNRPGIFRYVAWQFKKYYVDERTVKPILKKMYANNSTDLALIEGRSGISPIYPWFVKLYQKSIPGIADDFEFVLGNPRETLKGIKTNIVFIHGSDDPTVEVQIVERYADIPKSASVETIDGAGHHLFNTHADQIWEVIQAHCEALDS
jgi:pimeloyl-ACP methyl ester carboxylesterase